MEAFGRSVVMMMIMAAIKLGSRPEIIASGDRRNHGNRVGYPPPTGTTFTTSNTKNRLVPVKQIVGTESISTANKTSYSVVTSSIPFDIFY